VSAALTAAMPTTLSIVIPVFNEERRLRKLLDGLQADAERIASSLDLELLEVIVVEDGSTDRTAELLAEFDGLAERFRVIRFPRNRGKGAAVRDGMLAARGELALMTDADLSTPLGELGLLLEPVRQGADLAIGSRALDRTKVLVHQPIYRELMGRAFNRLLRRITKLPYRDTQCGFKLFRLDTGIRLFELQRVAGFAFDAELLVNARRLGLAVKEIPVRWIDDPDTHVSLVRSSAQMALDTLRIAYRSHRPL
jgi:dolichyl-phosphate beta-glucosyltransferase